MASMRSSCDTWMALAPLTRAQVLLPEPGGPTRTIKSGFAETKCMWFSHHCIVLAAPEQPQKCRATKQSRDRAHGEFARGERDAGHGIRSHQKRASQKQRPGQDDTQIFAEHQPQRVWH